MKAVNAVYYEALDGKMFNSAQAEQCKAYERGLLDGMFADVLNGAVILARETNNPRAGHVALTKEFNHNFSRFDSFMIRWYDKETFLRTLEYFKSVRMAHLGEFDEVTCRPKCHDRDVVGTTFVYRNNGSGKFYCSSVTFDEQFEGILADKKRMCAEFQKLTNKKETEVGGEPCD